MRPRALGTAHLTHRTPRPGAGRALLRALLQMKAITNALLQEPREARKVRAVARLHVAKIAISRHVY